MIFPNFFIFNFQKISMSDSSPINADSKTVSNSEDTKVSVAKTRYINATEPDCCLAETMRVTQILDIPGADRIQVYVVGGWRCIAAKNAFKQGDLVVYIRIGAVLDPSLPQWAFLEGNPLKTKKIRGVVSQGLIGPLDWMSPSTLTDSDRRVLSGASSNSDWLFPYTNLPENMDLTKLLHVKKYVEPEEFGLYAQLLNLSKSTSAPIPRPSFLPKTDAERVQNITQQQWQELKGLTAWNTRKEDGTSATYWFRLDADNSAQDSKTESGGEFGICSRNCVVVANVKGQEHYGAMNEKFKIEQALRTLNRSLAVQGEIVGPKINGNRMQLTDCDFRVFGMWDISKQCYLDPREVWELSRKMNLNTVPLISTIVISENEMSSDFWLQQADAQKYTKNVQAEGVVFMIHDQSRHLRFKAISNNYLLKHGL